MLEHISSELHDMLKAVADQLIPGDDWPSASDNGVLDYMKRRAREDARTWVELIEPGLRALDSEALRVHGCSFAALSDLYQNELLRAVEKGEVAGWSVSPVRFFAVLLNLVAEGYYGSPEAGGNRGGKSWEMIGFRPGPLTGNAITEETDLEIIAFDQVKDVYDAVIVGSGAGGSIAAGVLAEAGLQVLVIERGSWLTYSEVSADHLRNHRLSRYGHNTGPEADGQDLNWVKLKQIMMGSVRLCFR